MLDNLTLNVDKNISAKSAALLTAVAVTGVAVAGAKAYVDFRLHKAKAKVDKRLAEDLAQLPPRIITITETPDN